MTAPFDVPGPEQHITEARMFLARAEQPGLTAEGSSAYAVQAVAHALLAQIPEDGPTRPASSLNASGVLVLLILCVTALAAVWMVTR